ncbi:MAG: UvrB/UvrC motif-containing protein [Phycisphaeraceae bacterium]
MFQKPFVRWLVVLIALVGGGIVLRAVLQWRDLSEVADVATVVFVVLASAWCYIGLFWMWEQHWAKVATVYLGVSNYVWLSAAIALWQERQDLALAFMGFWGLLVVGLSGIAAIRALCMPSSPIFGIARTVINQAARFHITEAVIVVVVLLILGLPSWLEENRIDYRLTFYLTWSLRLSITALSVVTAVLAAFTITYDLTRKQMFMLASKPVSRFAYLAGKWLGLALLDLVLVAIVGLGVWLGAMLIYTAPIPENAEPEVQWSKTLAETEVLTSRVIALPRPHENNGSDQMLRAELAQLHRERPDIWPDTIEKLSSGALGEVRGKALARWHTIPPGGLRIYKFTGFEEFRRVWQEFMQRINALKTRMDELTKQERKEEAAAVRAQIEALVKKMPQTSLRLRFKPKYETAPDDEKVHMVWQVGNFREALMPMVNNTVREKPVPYQFIAEDGSITIGLYNVNAANPQATHPSNIKFVPIEGLQLIYQSGTFEGNVVASMFIHWVRLAFLAMVGLACGTFLGFPMAVATTIFILAIASLSGYAGEALASYTPLNVVGKGWWEIFTDVFAGMWAAVTALDFGALTKLFIKLLGDIVLFLIPSFSEYNPTPLLADGRAVSLSLILRSAFYVGVVWTGAFAFIGWLLFRNKELARITV